MHTHDTTWPRILTVLMLSLIIAGISGPVSADRSGGYYDHGNRNGHSAHRRDGHRTNRAYPSYRYERPFSRSFSRRQNYPLYYTPSPRQSYRPYYTPAPRQGYRGQSYGGCGNRVMGGAVGGAVGGLLGSRIGSGSGQLAATAAGALLGYNVGRHVSTAAYDCY